MSQQFDRTVSAFSDDSGPPVRGFLHRPSASPNDATGGNALVLTHGAGSNCQAPLLLAVANKFAATGYTVLRCDLPYRQKCPHGPPFPSASAEDRDGLRNGTHDAFGSLAEMESALKLIPAATALIAVDGTGHDLSFGREKHIGTIDLPSKVLDAFERFLGTCLGKRG